MKNLLRIILLLIAPTLSLSAMAVTIIPIGTAFTTSGSITISAPTVPAMTCSAQLSGVTQFSNTVSIQVANFTSFASPLCGTISSSGLPWQLQATSTTTATLSGIKINVGGVNCSSAPVTINGAWSNSSNTFTAASQVVGSCILRNLVIFPTPAFTVLP